jgi:hypothetical protein
MLQLEASNFKKFVPELSSSTTANSMPLLQQNSKERITPKAIGNKPGNKNSYCTCWSLSVSKKNLQMRNQRHWIQEKVCLTYPVAPRTLPFVTSECSFESDKNSSIFHVSITSQLYDEIGEKSIVDNHSHLWMNPGTTIFTGCRLYREFCTKMWECSQGFSSLKTVHMVSSSLDKV